MLQILKYKHLRRKRKRRRKRRPQQIPIKESLMRMVLQGQLLETIRLKILSLLRMKMRLSDRPS